MEARLLDDEAAWSSIASCSKQTLSLLLCLSWDSFLYFLSLFNVHISFTFTIYSNAIITIKE